MDRDAPRRMIWLACAVLSISAVSLRPSHSTQATLPEGNDAGDHMACVERLRYPEYPLLARQSRLEFSARAVVTLTKGTVSGIAYEQASDSRDLYTKLFYPVLDASIKSSQFSAQCDGMRVRVQYVFKLDTKPPVVAQFFGFPNRVEVWSVTPMRD